MVSNKCRIAIVKPLFIKLQKHQSLLQNRNWCFFVTLQITHHYTLITLLFRVKLVRNSQFLTTFSTTLRQYATTVFAAHAATESMLVRSFSLRWLKSPFHYTIFLSLFYQFYGAKRRVCAKRLQKYSVLLKFPIISTQFFE